ncbi:hypothetical protein Tco_0989645 [Tanacetum coccineum]|uniref:Uncharacterized protein n=1 Tax=Tanacetum coccineum TaxID=301880 RepID=A0ABQ5EU84_9ASTR
MLTPKPSSYYNGRCSISFANTEYLKKAQWEKPCLYNVQYNKNDLANMFAPESEETNRLMEKSRSKNPITHDIKLRVHDILIPLAHKTLKDVGIFENALKEEMLKDLKYVQYVEKEVDDLKMEIDDLKSQLRHEKIDFPKVNDLLLQEFFSKDFLCVILLSLDDIDEYCDITCKYLEKTKEWNNEKVFKAKRESLIAELNRKTIKISDLKAQLQDKTIVNADMRALLNKAIGKSMDTKFEKPAIVRQPNAFRFQKSSVLRKPSPFTNSPEKQLFPKSQFVLKTNEKKDLSKPITPQILPQNQKQVERNMNVIKPGMYRLNTSTQVRTPQLTKTFKNSNPHMSTSTGVIHNTSVSSPQLRSTQMKDKVMPNNSQVMIRKKKVEDHHRISSISNKTKSLTVCDNRLNVTISNAKVVCVTCDKYVFNSNHDAYVSKYISDMNARTKKANKTSKAWTWWIENQCPLGYKWKPKVQNDNALASNSLSLDSTSRDGENLDKRKEKGDPCIFFSSKLVPNDIPTSDKTDTSLQELELLFNPMHLKAGNQSVSKSSTLFYNLQQQDTLPTLNVQLTLEPIIPLTYVNFEEDNNHQAKAAQFEAYEFINPFAPLRIEASESSSCNVDTSNMHTFYQRHRSNYHWTKNHPLKQVRENPSKHVQTRQQLAIVPEMCMFALTMSTTEPKKH